MIEQPQRRLSSDRYGWLRRYPPLVSFVMALLIAFLILPSALTLPNANPSTVLEYAPVPPQKDEPPPPQNGSISSLGLGVSSTVSTGGDEGPGIGPVPDIGKGTRPITKRCVGKPLRQTEDPNAPPCVPYFEGDNGGTTYQGVTKDEVTVLVYASELMNLPDQNGDEAEQSPNAGTYCDTDAPPMSKDECLDQLGKGQDAREVRVARALGRYFNDRYQTYNRHVHVYVYYASGTATPSSRRADAADNWETLKPFAVVDRAIFGGYSGVYAEAMSKKNVSVYGNYSALPNSYYAKYRPYVWSFWPDVEHWAANYVTYLCQKIAPYPNVVNAGGGLNGKPRKYALLYADDPQFPGYKYFADLVRQGIQKCPNGAKIPISEEGTFPRHQYVIDSNPAAITAARQNVAKFQGAGITTVIWAGGFEVQHSAAAAQAGWLPEWVVAGDLWHDVLSNARGQDQTAWQYARVVSNRLREDRSEDAPCKQAYRESEPTGKFIDEVYACEYYPSLQQLFKAIQTAGPNLNPDTVDQGLHAIQRQKSPSVYVAACFYDPNDYTCVKDAQEMWWDPAAPDPEGRSDQRGCWRMVRDGKRYLPGEWEGTDRDAFTKRDDACNHVNGIGAIGT